MRIQAIRASETLYKAGDKSFAGDYKTLTKDPSVDVVIQAMLTINRWKVPDAAATIKAAMDGNQRDGVQVVGDDDADAAAADAAAVAAAALTPEQQAADRSRRGRSTTSCASRATATTGSARRSAELGTTMAPPLAGSPRVNGHRDYIIKAVLTG